MRRARILDWVRMRRSHDRYNDVEPSSPPQSSPDYTIVIRGYNFREGHAVGPRLGTLVGRLRRVFPRFMHVRHTAVIANQALKILLPLLEPTRYDATLPKFANYNELWSR